ncbi:MAG TPA: hypothetical protein VFD36_10890, partial [Kofleriaceae bacterium]|nr:hypothetical protein [Kofleriaceae bacterium]
MFWTAVLAALAVHVAILGTVHALGLSLISEGISGTLAAAKLVMDEVELKGTCAGDVALATSGRAALCFAPWIDNVDQCIADAQMSLWMDLSSCQARNDPSTAIAMIESKAADRLTPIDPERLIEEAKQEANKPPPPPPPPQIAMAQPAAPW